MFLLDWYEQYLSIKNDQRVKAKELLYCEACETLKLMIAVKNEECKMLIERLTDKPEAEKTAPVSENPKAVMPTSLRWGARQQMLEAEDREKAKALRKNPAMQAVPSGTALTVEAIEEELGVEKNG